MRSTPCSRVSARRSRSHWSGAANTPASPWIGSSMTAAVAGVIAFRTASRSPISTLGKPGTFGSNSESQFALPEAAIVARVRP